MRFPRWVVASLISFNSLAVVVTFVWLWLWWPGNTGEAFLELLREKKWEEASGMLKSNAGRDAIAHFRDYGGSPLAALKPETRTWVDFLLGRQRFRFDHSYEPTFVVERGKIVDFQTEPVFKFYVDFFR